ncbi:hypothetical protein ACFT7S_05535 [Streptomyces sp. NPDC057136]|uniref:hypothetical protein n=1 Tax=Streptomyces sp. NPDC057136 TaxID=3346029 RepID=UPI00363D7A71
MSEALRKKILLAKEKKERDEIEHALPNDTFLNFVDPGEIPDWVATEFSRFTRSTTPPDYTFTTESLHDLAIWVKSVAEDHGFPETLITHTGLQNFPWLKFRCLSPNWPESLLEAIGRDLTIISEDGEKMLVIFEEEHEYIAFVTSRRRSSELGHHP